MPENYQQIFPRYALYGRLKYSLEWFKTGEKIALLELISKCDKSIHYGTIVTSRKIPIQIKKYNSRSIYKEKLIRGTN